MNPADNDNTENQEKEEQETSKANDANKLSGYGESNPDEVPDDPGLVRPKGEDGGEKEEEEVQENAQQDENKEERPRMKAEPVEEKGGGFKKKLPPMEEGEDEDAGEDDESLKEAVSEVSSLKQEQDGDLEKEANVKAQGEEQAAAPQPTEEIQESQQKKSGGRKEKGGGGGKLKKVGLAVLGFFLLFGGVAAGYYFFFSKQPQIAEITGLCGRLLREDCTAASFCEWEGNQCISSTETTEEKTETTKEEDTRSDLPECKSVDIYIPQDTQGAVKCLLPGTNDVAYSCPLDRPTYDVESGECVDTTGESVTTTQGTYCTGYGAASCEGKYVGDACNKGVCKLVEDKNGREVCGCVSEGPSCGEAPDFNDYTRAPYDIGPFPEKGKAVLYYTGLDTGIYPHKFTIEYKGQQYVFDAEEQKDEERVKINTGIIVDAEDSITIAKVDDNKFQDGQGCEPESGPPFLSFGWTSMNSDTSCGTGLPGPPTGGTQTPYKIVDVASEVRWANADTGGSVIKRECWGDWREWPGDYDFNDFFVQVAYEPTEAQVACNTIEKDTETPSVGDEVAFTCNGSVSTETPLDYQFRWRVDSGEWNQTQLASSKTNTVRIGQAGTWEVQCRVCAGEICSASWQGAQ